MHDPHSPSPKRRRTLSGQLRARCPQVRSHTRCRPPPLQAAPKHAADQIRDHRTYAAGALPCRPRPGRRDLGFALHAYRIRGHRMYAADALPWLTRFGLHTARRRTRRCPWVVFESQGSTSQSVLHLFFREYCTMISLTIFGSESNMYSFSYIYMCRERLWEMMNLN
jgi:hypothetical protein